MRTSKLRSLAPRLSGIDQRRAKPPLKRADAIYLSPEWRELRDALIRVRGRRCEGCGKTLEDDGTPVRLVGDHVKELRDGGAPLDPANVQLLCTRIGGNGRPHADGSRGCCHARKTAAAYAERLGHV